MRTNVRIGLQHSYNTSLYHPDELLTVIGDDTDRVVQANPDAVIIVTSDLNKLNYNALKSDYGLEQMVQEPTR